MYKLLIAASGTGGHIFPALAVAEAMPTSWKVTWLGVPDRLESHVLPFKYDLETVRVGGLQGGGIRKLFNFLRLLFSVIEVFFLIRNKKINVVFTTGGYIAAPAILAAVLSRVPIVLHESNAEPGRVTRLLGKFCWIVAIGFEEAANRLKGCRTLFTGTPVRSSFLELRTLPQWVPKGQGPLIVVMGGSQGAIGLNNIVRLVIPGLLELGCRIVHLTGNNDKNSKKIINQAFVEKSFSDEIPALLQNCDLVISRAGAGALCELALCGTPAILIPYPHAKDKHQDFNALCVARIGAAVIVHQDPLAHEELWNILCHLLKNRLAKDSNESDPLIDMRAAMKSLSVFNSETKIVQIIEELIS